MTTQDGSSLESLADAYDVSAELVARDDVQTFLGTRRDDGAGVVVVVARPPRGDERNALTHYAADVKLLSGLGHRNLVPILEGRWIGTETFAVVMERVMAPTLEETLSREELSYPRIASILQDVNGLLEWARTNGVVHRALDWSTVHLEPGSDRVRASFEIRAIPVTGVPGAEGDASTIAALAWTMLARQSYGRASAASLAELRPDLPPRLVEETERVLRASRGNGTIPDVHGYITLVAMTRALSAAVEERQRVRAEILEEERIAEEAIAAGREELARLTAEQERRVAAEREEMERELATQQAALAEERADLERAVARERETLAELREELERNTAREREALAEHREELERSVARDREELASARAELEPKFARDREELEQKFARERTELEERVAQEREGLAKERAELEETIVRERERLAEERAELEQRIAHDQARLAAERVELERQHAALERNRAAIEQQLTELELRRNELELMREASPLVADAAVLGALSPVEPPSSFDSAIPAPATPAPEIPAPAFAAPAIEAPASAPAISGPVVSEVEPITPRRPRVFVPTQRRTRWAVPAAVAGLAAIAIAAAVAVGNRPSSPLNDGTGGGRPRVTVDSQAGAVAPPAAAPSVGRAAADSVPTPRPRRRVRVPVVADTLPSDTGTSSFGPPAAVAPITSPRRDSITRDSVAGRATLSPPRDRLPVRDSLARRDSAQRRDTTGANSRVSTPATPAAPVPARPFRPDSALRRDSIVRRDSLRRDSTARPRPDSARRPDSPSD